MMLREIITPKTQNYTVQIPLEYLNTQVEILVLPFINKQNTEVEKSTDIIRKTAGILSAQKIDPLKWQQEIRDDWEKRV